MVISLIVDAFLAAALLAFIVLIVVSVGAAIWASHEPKEKEPWRSETQPGASPQKLKTLHGAPNPFVERDEEDR